MFEEQLSKVRADKDVVDEELGTCTGIHLSRSSILRTGEFGATKI